MIKDGIGRWGKKHSKKTVETKKKKNQIKKERNETLQRNTKQEKIIMVLVVERVPKLCCVNGNGVEHIGERVSSKNEFACGIHEACNEAYSPW